jgi:DNA-binding CsgD family transcriptional regulator
MSASQSSKATRTRKRRREIVLLERDQALAEIEELVLGVTEGHGAIAAIVGGAGEGKTALLSVAGEIAERHGLRVWQARGSDLESGFALGAVRQLLEPAVHALDLSEHKEVLSGAAGLAASVLGLEVDRAPEPLAALHGLYWLLANLASRSPVLLAIDDAQWVDRASLEWLAYLRGRIDGLSVGIVLATRTLDQDAAGSPLHTLLGDPELTHLPVEALGKDSVATLIARTLDAEPHERFVACAQRVSGGNPLALHELLWELARSNVLPTDQAADRLGERAPDALKHNILARLGRLHPTAAQVAQSLAVLGDRAVLREVAALARVSLDEAAQAVDVLAREGILDRRQTLGFAHPLIHTAVYDALPARRRARLHAHAATILTEDGADPEAIAAQLQLADPAGDPRSVQSLREAARAAMRRGAPPAAAAYLSRALAEPPEGPERALLLHELAHAEMLIRSPAAIEHLQAALDAGGDPIELARLRRSLSDALLFAGEWDRAQATLAEAIEDIRGHDPDLTLRLEGRLVTLGTLDGRAARKTSDEDLARLLASAREDLDGARPLRLNLALLLAVRARPPAELLPLIERGLDGGRFLALETADAIEAVHAAFALVLIDRLDDALALTEQMLADAAQRGSVLGFLAGSTFRSLTYLRRGALADAEADAFATLEMARELGLLFTIPFIAGYLALTLNERGQSDAAAELLESIPLMPALAGTPAGITLLEARGRVHRARGETARAIEDLRACGEACESLEVSNPNVVAWRSELALALGDTASGEARALIERELELARRADVPRGIGVALRACAALAPASEREALLSEAAATLERSPASLELAHTLVDLGAHHRRAGHRTKAREHLLRGLELAHRCRADPLLVRAREELLAAGARPRRPWLTGIDALTPSELRVARLASRGRSNQEVAQALFITTQTVKGHLSSVYRKLGISSRRELDAALTQAPDGPA